MNRTVVAVALFAAAAVLVATGDRAATQPYAAVPSQTAHWQSPVVLSKADAARLDRIGDLLEQNNRLLEVIAAGARPVAVKAGPDKLATAKARCAGCHTPAKADAKGGGFHLFADDKASSLRILDGRQKAAVRRAVEEGTMPPAPAAKLTPAERSALTSP